MVQPVILEKLEKLSDSLQTEVLHHIEFLSERYTKTDEVTIAPLTKRGRLGSLKGQIWMADDFDAPLEDLQEYM